MVSVKIKPKSQLTESQPPDAHAYLIAGPFGWRISTHTRLWRPPTDAFETTEQIIVRVEIAGMGSAELNVHFDNQVLSIQGVRSENIEKRAYHQMEIHFGQFSTEVVISAPIDAEKIEAIYDDGFLWVYLPKARPKTIQIASKDEQP
ncbi:MAG: Hsp20/alpha crystallin family protein [Anaerolineaceae bacterium]|nr:Hsp20/alpha crystallin family protein [Anaerolineaceae bacterium]